MQLRAGELSRAIGHRFARVSSRPNEGNCRQFTGRKDLLSFYPAMTRIRMEVRDAYGKPLPDYCDDVLDLRLPGDHSQIAQSLLRVIRDNGRTPAAHSVHFFRDDNEIGSWSLDRDSKEPAFTERRERTPPAAA
jgi:hypothetical protein